MSILVDIFFALLIISMIAMFYIKGFMESLLRSVKLILSITVGLLLRPLFFAIYEGIGLLGKISGTISSAALRAAEGMSTVDTVETLTKMKIPESIAEKVAESLDKTGDTTICTQIGEKMGNFTVNCLSFLTGFVICLIAILILIRITHIIKVIPVIGAIDKTLGGLMGAITGVSLVYLIIVVVYAFSSVGVMKGIANVVDNSVIASFLYNNIVITRFLW